MEKQQAKEERSTGEVDLFSLFPTLFVLQDVPIFETDHVGRHTLSN